MDWMQQSADMMKSWTSLQQRMWQNWLDASARLGKAEENPMSDWLQQWQEIAERSLNVWEDFVRNATGTQAKWAEMAAGSWPGGNEDDMRRMAQTWSEQTQAMMQSWTDAQRKLWEGWFNVASNAARTAQEPSGDWFDRWQAAAKQSVEAWEELSRKTMDAQADAFKAWNEAGARTAKDESDASSSGGDQQPA